MRLGHAMHDRHGRGGFFIVAFQPRVPRPLRLRAQRSEAGLHKSYLIDRIQLAS